MEGNGRRMPRRYGVGGDGSVGRTWGGKLPEEFGTKERLLFMADNDLALYGQLTVETLCAIREAGFRYEVGKLMELGNLSEQGIKNKGKYPEVYRLSLGEAVNRGEADRFWEADNINCCCRLSMDSAISSNFKDGVLAPGCLKPVLEEYGFDRVEWVLANTIQENKASARISRENREWADGFHVPRNDPLGGSTWLGSVMSSPVEAVEQAAVMVREEHALQKDRKECRKPSIREQLAENTLAIKNGSTNKKVAERDAR